MVNMFRALIFLMVLFFYTGCTHVPVATSLGLKVPKNVPFEPVIDGVGVALVLGGGGSKGLAHVGVLEVLEENDIPINLIVGTSSGAGVGAMYASFVNAQAVKELLLHLGKWDLLDLSISSMFRMAIEASGPVSGYYLEKFFIEQLPEKEIEQLSIPFAAVAVDIETSQPFVIKSGPIAPAVHASAAIPPFFCPVKLYGKTLVDGGVMYPVPVAIASDYKPKLIISVDIAAPPTTGCLSGSFELTYRSLEISYYMLSRMQAKCADIDIHPNLEGFGMFDDDRNEELYRRGIEAARKAIPEIKKKLKELGIPLGKSKARGGVKIMKEPIINKAASIPHKELWD